MADRADVLEEQVLHRSRPALWFAHRPRVADVLVILATAAPTIAALALAQPPDSWLGYLCALGVATAFWWRRAHPLAVLLIVVVLATLSPLSRDGMTVAFFESAFALYALASNTRLRTAVLGYLASEGLVVAVCGLTIWMGWRDDWPVVLLRPVSLVALAIGVAVRATRSRRAAIAELIRAREERAEAAERARITAEMHDVVAHSVTVMIALAGGAQAGWDKHPERARQALEQLGSVGAQALEEMQRILRVLREKDPDLDRNLESSGHNVPSLEELIEVFRTAGLPARLTLDPGATVPVSSLDPALQTTIYRIVQESLTNVLRHAGDVTFVEVEIAQQPEGLTVTVTDNGRGARTRNSQSTGVGLRAMRERANAFHGEFEAGPLPTSIDAPSSGWRTRVTIPLTEAKA